MRSDGEGGRRRGEHRNSSRGTVKGENLPLNGVNGNRVRLARDLRARARARTFPELGLKLKAAARRPLESLSL